MHWETKVSSDRLYCDIHFTVVVWNPTPITSELCLYFLKPTLSASIQVSFHNVP